jgi:hypothetical protein
MGEHNTGFSSFLGGEKMNRKILLVIAVALLAIALLATPVLAIPTNGKKVEVSQISGSTISTATVCSRDGETYPYTGIQRLTPGEATSHRYDYGTVMNTKLIIHLGSGDVTLNGLSFNNYDRVINFFGNYPVLTGMMMVYHYDAIWEFQPQAGLNAYGGFEGNINMVITDYNPGPPTSYQAKFNCVLHGFGAFEGQTIQFTYNGPNGQPWPGYLLKA